MSWWAAGAAIGGALINAWGSNKAAGESADGSQAAAQAQLQMYGQSRQDNMPWQYAGTQSLNTMLGVMGLNPWTPNTPDYWRMAGRNGQNGAPGGAPGQGGGQGGGGQGGPSQDDKFDRGLNPWYDDKRDMSYRNRMAPFFASPDYNFRMDEGLNQLDRYNAANGRYLSGAQLKATQRYAGDLASGEFDNWWNKMAGIAGVGQTAAGRNSDNAMTTGGRLANSYQNAADARASGYGNAAQGFGNAFSDYMYYRGQK